MDMLMTIDMRNRQACRLQTPDLCFRFIFYLPLVEASGHCCARKAWQAGAKMWRCGIGIAAGFRRKQASDPLGR